MFYIFFYGSNKCVTSALKLPGVVADCKVQVPDKKLNYLWIKDKYENMTFFEILSCHELPFTREKQHPIRKEFSKKPFIFDNYWSVGPVHKEVVPLCNFDLSEKIIKGLFFQDNSLNEKKFVLSSQFY